MRQHTRFSKVGALLVALSAPAWASCGGKRTPISPTPSIPTPTVKGVSISGNVNLTRVGDTSQLTATATLSDGTTQDSTATGTWTTTDSGVATITEAGVITVVRLGATYVRFAKVYPTVGSRNASLLLTATPPGTFSILGEVREPGVGPLRDAKVTESTTGSTITNTGGIFSLGGVLSLPAHLKVEKSGYETVERDVTETNADLPVQEIVRLTAGETMKPAPLAPHDLSYDVNGQRCDDCRLIRVAVPQAGTLHVHVTWASLTILTLFADGQIATGTPGQLTADLAVAAPREIQMYLGVVPPGGVLAHMPFTLETSMR